MAQANRLNPLWPRQFCSGRSPAAAPPPSTERTATGMANTNIHIGGLPLEVDDAQLASIFSAYGTITWSRVFDSKGKPNKAAIVEFADAAEAKWVVESLNGNIPQGLTEPITVAFKQERGKGTPKGGYGKAVGGGGSPWSGKGSSPYEGGMGGGAEVCRNFQRTGECKFGASCKFSH
uniref:C3H1-type domain-containing protein n=1 Tax=Alexandrium monilatum TaxID=311494 RepID=A0A7S4SYJ5_9DINO